MTMFSRESESAETSAAPAIRLTGCNRRARLRKPYDSRLNIACVFLLCVVGTTFAADAPESATVRGDSTTTRKRLSEAEQKVLSKKPAEAIDELQRILDEAGDDLVSADNKQFTSARQYVSRFLAKLPAAELKKYQDRVEEPAAKLLALGKSTRDAKVLHELLDRYAVSRPAEGAHLLLAELAFERGEFSVAEQHWRALLPEHEHPYPGAKADAALLRAKIILSYISRGEKQRAAWLIEEFAKNHANAEGKLAGKTGKLVDSLSQLLIESPRIPAPSGPGTWTTLGGSPSRDGRITGEFTRHWPSSPTWISSIPNVPGAERGDTKRGRPASVGIVKTLAFHPVVMNGRAYIADTGRVMAFDLRTGKADTVFDIREHTPPRVPIGELKTPINLDADFTLTAAEGKLFLRVGQPVLLPNPSEEQPATTKPSALICLNPKGEILWKRFPPVTGESAASWEAAPIVVDGFVLAAFARADAGRVIHAIACYGESSEKPLWVTDVCETATLEGRARHEPLTLAGRNVVFCSHSGVISAVNMRTGRHAWSYRYSRVKKLAGDGRFRDLSSPVAADGRVFVAPNDGNQLFAFDAETGKLLWEDGPILVDHLIGVSAGKVVATMAGPQRGIRAYDAATGSTDYPHGWRNHDDPLLPAFGRGFLTDDLIAWPTSSALYLLRLADGTVAAQPLRGPHGNLAFAGNVLLVATATELRGYVRQTEEPDAPPTKRTIWTAKPKPSTDKSQPVKVELPPIVRTPLKFERVEAAKSAPPLLPKGMAEPTASVKVDGAFVHRVGEHQLVAVDAVTGELLWLLDALKRQQYSEFLIESAPRFLSLNALSGSRLLVQISTGWRWLLDAATGKILHEWRTLDRAWNSVAIGEGLAIVADTPGGVVAMNADDGSERWQFNAPGPASLSGESPGILYANGSVFVAVTRNHGVEIDRLAETDGRRFWRDRPAFVNTAHLDLSAATADEERLYTVLSDRATAFKLDTGREAWNVPLPVKANWRTLNTRGSLVLVPREAIAVETNRPIWESFLQFPHPRRLPALLGTVVNEYADRTVPVLLLDRESGGLQQRLDLAGTGEVTIVTSTEGITLSIGRHSLTSLSRK